MSRALPTLLDVKERMYAISFDPDVTTPEEFDRILRKQIEIFTVVAKAPARIASEVSPGARLSRRPKPRTLGREF